ncbi:beta-galactosidase trimerization domain-containing protein [candidate division KSB1 bacterium]
MKRGSIILLSITLIISITLASAATVEAAAKKRPSPREILWSGQHNPDLVYEPREKRGRTDQSEDRIKRLLSDENMQKTVDLGVSSVRTHFFRGFGREAEKQGWDLAVDLHKQYHKYGIKTSVYVQYYSLMFETFFLEEPGAKKWVQRAFDNQPVSMSYGFGDYRYKPCFNHPEAITWWKNMIDFALDDIKSDAISWDNVAELNPEPESCQCDVCIAKFREFLGSRYTRAQLLKRYGLTDPSEILPPRFNRQHSPRGVIGIVDPLYQDWVDFRVTTLNKAFFEINTHVRSKRPDIYIDVNPHGIIGGNRAWQRGIDPGTLLDGEFVDSFSDEVGRITGIHFDNVLFSKIRNYKLSRTNNVTFHELYTSDPLTFAMMMAFNPQKYRADWGWVGEPRMGWGSGGMRPTNDEDMIAMLEWFQANNGHLQGADNIADVAVLRSYASMAYDNHRPHLATNLYEQSLFQARVPFDIIFDKQLAGDLSQYKVIVLADQICLSDEQLGIIRSFVKNGGGVVGTGATSVFDEWRWLRPNFGLRDLFGVDFRGRQGGDDQNLTVNMSGATYNEVGKGRAVYLADVTPSEPVTRGSLNLFLPLASNHGELVDAVRWASGKDISVEIQAPVTTVAEFLTQPKKNEIVITLVNFDREQEVTNIAVSLKIPAGKQVKNVALLSPDWAGNKKLPYRKNGDRIEMVLPKLVLFDMVVVTL